MTTFSKIDKQQLNDPDSEEHQVLTTLAATYCNERKQAINARERQGLDRCWRLARDQYQGKDEENQDTGYRGTGPFQSKSADLDSPLVASPKTKQTRSTVFVNITRPYTDSGTARIADIYLPTGKAPWKLKTTPVSELELIKGVIGQFPLAGELLPAFPELAERLQMEPEVQEQAMLGAETLIKDWHAETKWLGELRLLIKEMGQIGVGILKGPVAQHKILDPTIKAFYAALLVAQPEAARQLELQLLYLPKSECIKAENFYPDGMCGSDIQNGAYTFERVPSTSRRMLEDLLEDDTYISSQIQVCLEEGAKKPGQTTGDSKKPYDLWIRTGKIRLTELIEESEFTETDSPYIFGTTVICNDRIIKIAELELDDKRFPYSTVSWREREDSWAGIGIPEDMETPQRGLNASVRAMQDNLAYSVGPQLLVMPGIEPDDGDWQMYPYKRWNAQVDGITKTLDDVKKALSLIEFTNYTNELMPVINFWLKMAEDTTGLPLLLQGQSSSEAVGVSQQLQNNATTNLRLIIKALDDDIVTVNVGAYYKWSQTYGPPNVKGDAAVEALGSSVLVIKELQQQALLQIGDRVLDPVYEISPKKWMAAFLEGHQLDAEKLGLDDEEREQLAAAAEQPDPTVQAAQIRAEVDKYVADLEHAIDQLKLQVDVQAKGASLAHASEVTDTQSATQIALESMKQDGEKEKIAMQGDDTATPNAAALPPEPTVDEALNSLGFVS